MWSAARFTVLLFSICSAAFPSFCDTGGTVLDPSGAPIPEVALSLYTTSRTAMGSARSGADGAFSFGSIPCGSYVLSARHSGFAETRLPVRLDSARRIPLSVFLSLVPVEEQITVTAEAGAIEKAESIDQRMTLVSRSALAERAKTVLTESARHEVGVNEQRTAPAMGSFVVRGLTGKNVSVYRDGFRHTTAVQRGGVSTFQNLVDPAFLDSVEFVRGSNSAQYGSDSVGGTVNLLSTFPLDQSRRITGEAAPAIDSAAASFGSHLLLGINASRFHVVTTLAGRRINTARAAQRLDSHSAVSRFLGLPAHVLGDRLPDTAFTQYGGSIHGQMRPSSQQAIVLHYERGQQDGAKRYDQLLGGDGNLIADLRNLMLDFGYVRYQRYSWGVLDQLSFGASYNAQREQRVNQGGQGNPLAAISHQYERLAAWGFNFLGEKRMSRHDLAAGGEGYLERVAAPSFTYNPVNGTTVSARGRVPDGARYLTHGVYVQDVWRPAPRIRISGSLRFGGASYRSGRTLPIDSLAANALTGRIGASVRLAGPLFAHGRYSRGFRAPNITDLGTLGLQGNGAFETNPNDVMRREATIGDRADDRAQPTGRAVERLRPETSGNYDAGLTMRHRRVRVELTAFWMNLGNTIVSQTLLLPQGVVGQMLGDQVISRQLPSGAVFVPLSAGPVLVRGNYFGARMRGVEHSLRIPITSRLTFNENVTWIQAWDERTELPPDIEPGVPPLTGNPSFLYTRRRFWVEPYGVVAGRQDRLSSLALGDRRIGAARSRANIASFFNNGARAHGLVSGGLLTPTGETLEQVQNRVLGTAASAPLFTAIPGYGLVGVRAGVPVGENGDLFVDLSNVADKTFRGIGWGIAGTGRSMAVRYRVRF
ncbi:MAG TPA: TonB-dependent receptor [Bryobacteraceae bacterium]|nr:TonB-dependent receptor [Bryobacteraceae bacterium]